MNLFRTSLRTQILIVALVAVDLVVVRAFWGSRYNILRGIALSGLVLSAGLFCLVRARGRARAFWVGFLLAGLLAAGSFAWALSYPKASATILDQKTGQRVTIRSPGAPLSDEWDSYLDFAEESIGSLPNQWNPYIMGDFAEVVADASIAFAPQLSVALAGGLLFWLCAVVIQASACAIRRRPSKPAAARTDDLVL